MQKLDRLIIKAAHEKSLDRQQRKHKEIKNAIGRMTMDQLQRLAYDDMTDQDIESLFASVGGLAALESG